MKKISCRHTFFKLCSCGRGYSYKEFMSLPFNNNLYSGLNIKDACLKCEGKFDTIMRDCYCCNTLEINMECSHKISKRVAKQKPAISKRAIEKHPSELYHSPRLIDWLKHNAGIVKMLKEMFGPAFLGMVDAMDAVYDPKKWQSEFKFLDWYLNSDMSKEDYKDIMSHSSANESDAMDQDYADDEPNKYEREAKDPKWQDVYIEKDGVKLTRKQIRDYYVKNASKILKEIKNDPVMLYIATGKNKNILKRNHDDKPIIITSSDQKNSGKSDNLLYWADRHLLSIHKVYGTKTKRGVVDLDLHGDFPLSKAKEYAKEVASEIKKGFGVSASLWNSGGTGIHIEFDLKQEEDIDKLRSQLKNMLDKLNESYDNITTGLVKGNGLRSDISTLHSKGNIRVRYALGETQGKPKEPMGKISSRE